MPVASPVSIPVIPNRPDLNPRLYIDKYPTRDIARACGKKLLKCFGPGHASVNFVDSESCKPASLPLVFPVFRSSPDQVAGRFILVGDFFLLPGSLRFPHPSTRRYTRCICSRANTRLASQLFPTSWHLGIPPYKVLTKAFPKEHPRNMG